MNPAKPTALKILEGTFRKDRASKNEPKPKNIMPRIPLWLHPMAKTEWRRVGPSLFKLGLLTIEYEHRFASYCQNVAIIKQISNYFRKKSFVKYLEDKNSQTAQLLTEYHRAIDQNKAICAEYGMQPSAMSTMNIEGQPEEEDPMVKLLRKKNGK